MSQAGPPIIPLEEVVQSVNGLGPDINGDVDLANGVGVSDAMVGMFGFFMDEDPANGVFHINGQLITNGAIDYPDLAAKRPGWVVGNDLQTPDWSGLFFRNTGGEAPGTQGQVMPDTTAPNGLEIQQLTRRVGIAGGPNQAWFADGGGVDEVITGDDETAPVHVAEKLCVIAKLSVTIVDAGSLIFQFEDITNVDSVVASGTAGEYSLQSDGLGNFVLVPVSAGPAGPAGDSAYEVALANGFVGTEAQWLASLVGADGADGTNGTNGLDGNDGADGTNGTNGVDGDSAYEIAVAGGFVGTEAQWLASLVGADGADGTNGTNGTDGLDGTNGTNGTNGTDGDSAYEIAVAGGFVGTEAQWLTSLVGADGADGNDGADGTNGTNGTNGLDGDSAYDIAVAGGFVGTEAQWITSLQGADGADGTNGTNGTDGLDGTNGTNGTNGVDGDSAYEVSVAGGFVGTEAQWLASLVGADGADGTNGTNGTDGNDGLDGTNGTNGVDGDSAYDIAVAGGFVGTEAQWLLSLEGADGTNGTDGNDGADGTNGTNGTDGDSAYELAVAGGFVGTEAQWLASLQGSDGADGTNGTNGTDGLDGTNGTNGTNGTDGDSAYEIAVAGGFVGTEAQWLASLVGADGADGTNGTNGTDGLDGTNGTNGTNGVDGDSAYDIAVAGGFVGTEAQWITSLQGADGADGTNGTNGTNGVDGNDGLDGTNGTNGVDGDSAYDIAVAGGFVGTEAQWLASLVGADGADGTNGTNGTDGLDGTNGTNGTNGVDGDSAYEIAVAGGFVGTEAQWLTSLQGADGTNGTNGTNGVDGNDGLDGTNGTNGVDGDSAYEIAVAGGFVGTEAQWLASLVGADGADGTNGTNGTNGVDGNDGLDGTNGTNGVDGDSAYEIAVAGGFVGTEAQWLASLVGADGADGTNGTNGTNGVDGNDGADGTNGTNGVDGDSAYQVAVNGGFVGTEAQWLASLVGADGADGTNGTDGVDGTNGTNGTDGVDGANPYDIAVAGGYTGTEVEFNDDLSNVGGPGNSPWSVNGSQIEYGTIDTDTINVVFKEGNGLTEYEDRFRFSTRRGEWLGVLNSSNVSFQGGRILAGRHAGASWDTEVAMPLGWKLGEFLGAGYNGSYYDATAGMMLFTTEAWSVGNIGTAIGFYTVPNGSTTQTLAMWLNELQEMTLPAYPETRDDGVNETNRYLTVNQNGQVLNRKRYSEYAQLNVPTGNNGTAWLEALNLQFNPPYTGDFKVTVSYIWSANTTGNDFMSRVQRDNVGTIWTHTQEPKDPAGTGITVTNLQGGTFNSGTSQRYGWSQTRIETFTAGTHNLDLDIRGDIADIEPTIYSAMILVEEV